VAQAPFVPQTLRVGPADAQTTIPNGPPLAGGLPRAGRSGTAMTRTSWARGPVTRTTAKTKHRQTLAHR